MRGAWLAGGLALALAGCDGGPPPDAGPVPPPPAPATPPPPSAESRQVAQNLARVQASLLTRGQLRTDGGGPDTPFNARMLARDFIRIALFDEYTPVGGSMVQRSSASKLRRWEGPVRINLEFGPSIPVAVQEKDRRAVTDFVARLARITGHPISMADSAEAANYHVLVLSEDERRASGARLRALMPGIGAGPVRTIIGLNPDTFCLVFAFSDGAEHRYARAVAVVRGEHPDLMRMACYHEEIAQGLGLANDSPQARPSIFNDDEEFALLTRHDELLLRMLYDPRLRPGMTEAEARPIAEAIAVELLGGES
jgi:hypothetical protein